MLPQAYHFSSGHRLSLLISQGSAASKTLWEHEAEGKEPNCLCNTFNCHLPWPVWKGKVYFHSPVSSPSRARTLHELPFTPLCMYTCLSGQAAHRAVLALRFSGLPCTPSQFSAAQGNREYRTTHVCVALIGSPCCSLSCSCCQLALPGPWKTPSSGKNISLKCFLQNCICSEPVQAAFLLRIEK